LFQIPDEFISSAANKEVDDVMITVLLVTANILVIAVIAGTTEPNILIDQRVISSWTIDR